MRRVVFACVLLLLCSLCIRFRTETTEYVSAANLPYVQAAEFVGADTTAPDQFGGTVAISADGTTAIVGAMYNRSQSGGVYVQTGAAYIFTHTGGAWVQQAKVTASDAQPNDYFGNAVAINGDGNTVIVGAAQKGAAYVFVRTGSAWAQQAKLQ